ADACSWSAIRRRRRLAAASFLRTWPCFESGLTGCSNSCSATTPPSVRSRFGGRASSLSTERRRFRQPAPDRSLRRTAARGSSLFRRLGVWCDRSRRRQFVEGNLLQLVDLFT